MPKFVELWVYLSASPLFGLTATLVVYVLAQAAYARLNQAPWANPVLWTVITIAGVLMATDVSYPALAGGFAASSSALALGWAFNLPHDVVLSLAPKSVTAPVAMGIADKIGGIPALAAVFAVVTGMVAALSGKYLFDALKVPTDAPGWMARGFALGTAGHGIGAARALQVDANAGAFAGLALGLQVLLASLLIPLAFRIF